MSNEKTRYVQYGCGPFSNPNGWENFDTSPTLRLQRLPIIGKLTIGYAPVVFSENIKYGDILKGLPNVDSESCDAVFCSHVLEHLTLADCKIAISNTYKILKKDGVFRCIVPDLEAYALQYLKALKSDATEANHIFLGRLMLHQKNKVKSVRDFMIQSLGNAGHKYMWDKYSLKKELTEAGFSSVRLCKYNDSAIRAFESVENIERFSDAIAFEAIK
ncbi:MAG: putative SAM-dependent methyltransferase [Psychroserpens sp.]|jgi:predicted SAM-dependent methyltransferase